MSYGDLTGGVEFDKSAVSVDVPICTHGAAPLPVPWSWLDEGVRWERRAGIYSGSSCPSS
jgi:hypothetical protein